MNKGASAGGGAPGGQQTAARRRVPAHASQSLLWLTSAQAARRPEEADGARRRCSRRHGLCSERTVAHRAPCPRACAEREPAVRQPARWLRLARSPGDRAGGADAFSGRSKTTERARLLPPSGPTGAGCLRLPGRRHDQLGGHHQRAARHGAQAALLRGRHSLFFARATAHASLPTAQVFEGFTYKLSLNFPADYPYAPPTVEFARASPSASAERPAMHLTDSRSTHLPQAFP